MMVPKFGIYVFAIAAGLNLVSCGTNQPTEGSEPSTSFLPGASGGTAKSSTSAIAQANHSRAETWMQLLESGQINDGKIRLNLAQAGLGLTSQSSQDVEISVIDNAGVERVYERSSVGEVEIEIGELGAEQDLKVLIRDNGGNELHVESLNAGAAEVLPESKIIRRHGDIALKAFIVLARECRENSADGNSTIITKADAGKYFVQPFVFIAKLGPENLVSLVDTAKVSIQAEGLDHKLVRLSELQYSNFREMSGLTAVEHIAWTRNFYNHYFSAPGELYTIAQFRKQAPCADAPQVSLGESLNQTQLELVIEDEAQSPAIQQRIPIRPTIQPAFSTYLSHEQKLSDWTQCTIDSTTALPKTYNGEAEECLQISMSQSPFVKLDYLLPSQANHSLTPEVDPTRLLFYGHAKSREMIEKILSQAERLAAVSNPELELDSCIYTGGLTSVPLNGESYAMPLKEMNATVGSVINTARRSGSFAALPDFFQGDARMVGDILMPTCIPGKSSCDSYKTIKFQQKSCWIKADSGVATASISDSFVYPDYFEISGVVTE